LYFDGKKRFLTFFKIWQPTPH